jgi:hypothetical protein
MKRESDKIRLSLSLSLSLSPPPPPPPTTVIVSFSGEFATMATLSVHPDFEAN